MPSAPVSLYLDLDPGEKADLEVVAKASLAFAAAIKELAYLLDPSIEIKIELTSGTEGSLSLNSVLKAIKDASDQPVTLKALAITSILWFGGQIATHEVQKWLDAEIGPSPTMSDADAAKVADMVTKAMEKKIAQRQVQQVYRELAKDPHIKGVGATLKPATKPTVIVPRSQFAERSGGTQIEEVIVTKRERTTEEHVTLIKPVLLKAHRRWRFSYRHGEFSAPILDDEFLERLYDGKLGINLAGGIEMDVKLQTIEEFRDNVWVITGRNVLKVLDTRRSIEPPALPLGVTLSRKPSKDGG
jgi:hypothetical protein